MMHAFGLYLRSAKLLFFGTSDDLIATTRQLWAYSDICRANRVRAIVAGAVLLVLLIGLLVADVIWLLR